MINIVVGENTDLMFKSIINLKTKNFKTEILSFPETYKSNSEQKKWFYEFLSKFKSDKEYYIYTHSKMIMELMNKSIHSNEIHTFNLDNIKNKYQ